MGNHEGARLRENVLCRDAQRRVRFAPNPADAPLRVPTIPSIVKTVPPSTEFGEGPGWGKMRNDSHVAVTTGSCFIPN